MIDIFKILATGLFCLSLQAQQGRLLLGVLDKIATRATETVDVTLDKESLKMAAQCIEGDTEVKEAIRNLQGIYVRVFEFDKPGAYAAESLAAIQSQLQGWNRIVSVKSKEDGNVDVYLLADGRGGSRGLVVITAEEHELSVVNLVGAIDLKKLGSLEGRLGIPKIPKAAKKGK